MMTGFRKGLGMIVVFGWALGVGTSLRASEGQEGSLFSWGGGARSLGMGKAFLAVANDATASYWNPAGLSQLKWAEVSALQAQLFEETAFGFLAAALPLGPGAVLGVNAVWLTTGGIEGRDEWNQVTHANLVSQKIGATGAFGVDLFQGLRVGVSVKYLERVMAGRSTGFVTGDISGLWTPASMPFSLGIVGRQVASSRLGDTADTLPAQWVVGCAGQILQGLTISGDVDGEGRWHVGSEYGLWSLLDLRAGTDAFEQSAGVGITWQNLRVDYAAAVHRDLGLSNRLSMTIQLRGEKP